MSQVPALGNYQGRSVLVTGSTGFKGAWLCEWLLELGANVTGYALAPDESQPLFAQLGLDTRITQHYADIRDMDAVRSVLASARPELVFHLAAQSVVRRGFAEPHLTFSTNTLGSLNLLEAIRMTRGVRSLVYVTTDKVYANDGSGRPYQEDAPLGGNDPYGASKAAAELLLEAYGRAYFGADVELGWAAVRAGNVIGGGDWTEDAILPDIVRALRGGAPLLVRNPSHTRPWQHVLDVLNGYLRIGLAIEADPSGYSGAWNFGPPNDQRITVQELVRCVHAAWGGEHTIAASNNVGPHEASSLSLCSDKAKRRLGWSAQLSFVETVERTIEWYRRVSAGSSAAEVTQAQIRAFPPRRSA